MSVRRAELTSTHNLSRHRSYHDQFMSGSITRKLYVLLLSCILYIHLAESMNHYQRIHFPKIKSLKTIEKNILKVRGFEMLLFLFYAEDIKRFVVEAIRATDNINGCIVPKTEKLPHGTKDILRKAWKSLERENIINKSESIEIQQLLDYRNTIAHQTHLLTADIGDHGHIAEFLDGKKYDNTALSRIRFFHKTIKERMRCKYVMALPLISVIFEAAEKTYFSEIYALEQRNNKLMSELDREVSEANKLIEALQQRGVLKKIAIHDQSIKNTSGQLSKRGVEYCMLLYDEGASPIVVSHLLHISLHSAGRWHKRWKANAASEAELGS